MLTAMRRLILTLIALGALAASAAPAAAQEDTAAAREHFLKGKAFYDLGKYNEAVTEYEKAYEAKADPALLYNLAQSHRLAGNPEQALHFYRTYLRYVPKAPNRAEIEGRIAALEKQIGQKPSTATGQTPPGPTPQPQPPVQQPPVVAQPPVSQPPVQPMGAPPPEQANNPWAQPQPQPGMPGAPPADPYGTAPQPNPMPAQPYAPDSYPPPAGSSDSGRKLKIAGAVTGGVGVLSLIIGAAYGSQAKSAQHDLESQSSIGVYDTSLQAIDAKGRSAQAKETAFIGLGVVAVAAGGVIYFLGARQSAADAGGAAPPPAPPPPPVSLLPSVGPGFAGGTLRVAY
jgi:tetratricopeptide (TPR) repeat protein